MVRHAIPLMVGAAIGWFAAVVWDGPDALVVPVALFALWFLYCKVWVRRQYPRRVLAYARKHLDPHAGPPPGATPVELWLAKRMDEIGEGDADSIRALYTADCRFYAVGRKRPQSLDKHMRVYRATRGWLGETTSAYVTTFADPHEQDGFWLLGEQQVNPRRGEPFEIKWVEAWTLTPGRDRIRQRAVVAFTDAATRSA
jgi:hypothetical protein